MIDYLFLIIIGGFALFGFFRGFVSQLTAVLGFACVFLFAKPFSTKLDSQVIELLGTPRPYVKTIALLWAAFIIYVGVRLVGFFIEKLLIKKSGPLKTLNRLGGGFLGGIKGLCIVVIIFYILYLIPTDTLNQRAPKVRQSLAYQTMVKYPVFDRNYLESMMSPISSSTQEQINSLMKKEDPGFIKQLEKEKAQNAEAKINEKELLDELNSHLNATQSNSQKKQIRK